MDVFSELIFLNENFEWSKMVPTDDEIKKFPILVRNRKLRSQNGQSGSSKDGDRVDGEKEKTNTKEEDKVDGEKEKTKKKKKKGTKISGRKVTRSSKRVQKRKEEEYQVDEDEVGVVGFGEQRKNTVILRKVRKITKENAKIMPEIKEIKKKAEETRLNTWRKTRRNIIKVEEVDTTGGDRE
ncbi:unnamed protein product [Cuscuta europaea]|uniref:Uncharacterized protein n=1 Tax=Cuscuta europaea TaxID=41803 RepID=A0A9P1E4H6_CUSEU|nr:unnamed protein product [Cuscuta europaea]